MFIQPTALHGRATNGSLSRSDMQIYKIVGCSQFVRLLTSSSVTNRLGWVGLGWVGGGGVRVAEGSNVCVCLCGVHSNTGVLKIDIYAYGCIHYTRMFSLGWQRVTLLVVTLPSDQ